MSYTNRTIDTLLTDFKPILGKDYLLYRNHVYRIFLNCLLIDKEKDNEEKYAIAAVFHDIGIWTNHTFNYINPSIEHAGIYLQQKNQQHWAEEITLMINWHHKLSKYKDVHHQTVNSFRKADWIDVSMGLLNFGNKRKIIRQQMKAFPTVGFHRFLLKSAGRYFLKHPLNPLPMFKK